MSSRITVGCALALTVAAVPAVGDTFFYDNEAEFSTDSALIGVTFSTDSFEGDPATNVLDLTLLNSAVGVQYRIPDSAGSADLGVFDAPFVGGFATAGSKWLGYQSGTNERLVIRLPFPVNACSLDLTDFGDNGTGTLTLSTNAGDSQLVGLGGGPDGNQIFVGVINTLEQFDVITLTNTVPGDFYGVDRVRWGAHGTAFYSQPLIFYIVADVTDIDLHGESFELDTPTNLFTTSEFTSFYGAHFVTPDGSFEDMGIWGEPFSGGFATDGTNWLGYQVGFGASERLIIDLPGPANIFGFDLTDYGDFGSGQLVLSNDRGDSAVVAVAGGADGNLRFVGVYNGAFAFTRVTLTNTIVGEFYGIDNLLWGRTCLPDLNGDGRLNLDDIDAFATAFITGDPLADLTGDSILNLDDIDAFATSFVAGCP